MSLKSTGKIGPFETYQQDVGNVYLMLHQAIALLPKTWIQSPHWDREPTKEMLEAEKRIEDEADAAEEEIRRLAGEIYKSLVGSKSIKHLRCKNNFNDLLTAGKYYRVVKGENSQCPLVVCDDETCRHMSIEFFDELIEL